jgi:DNA modification methylase
MPKVPPERRGLREICDQFPVPVLSQGCSGSVRGFHGTREETGDEGMTDHRIIQGDVLDGLRSLPDCCIQTVVTNPPYYALRNYGVEGQIGSEETLEEFISKIVEVFREVRRVLREDGTLWLNFGDSYAGSGRGPTGKNGIGNQFERRGFVGKGPSKGLDEFKSKDMMGVPWRVAFALQADGWYLHSDIIWNKPNPMPESVTDRPTKSHEYIFLMTKSPRYFYDAEAIREGVSGGTHDRGDYKGDLPKTAEPGQGIKQNSSWTKACWGQPEGTGKKKAAKKQDQTGNPTYTGFNERCKENNSFCDGTTRNARTVWTITTQARPEAHFATFPDEIPRRCISAGTSKYGCCPKCGAPYQRIVEASGGVIGASWHPHENDEVTGQVGFKSHGYKREFKGWKPGCDCIIEGPPEAALPVPCVVLDPFLGIGTTMRITRDLGRSSIGIELNPAYIKIARKLLQADSQLDTGAVNYRFEMVPS